MVLHRPFTVWLTHESCSFSLITVLSGSHRLVVCTASVGMFWCQDQSRGPQRALVLFQSYATYGSLRKTLLKCLQSNWIRLTMLHLWTLRCVATAATASVCSKTLQDDERFETPVLVDALLTSGRIVLSYSSLIWSIFIKNVYLVYLKSDCTVVFLSSLPNIYNPWLHLSTIFTDCAFKVLLINL